MSLQLAWVNRPATGESLSGDAVVVRRSGKVTLFGVVDALGHGEQAHHVAQRTVTLLQDAALDVGVDGLLKMLHRALHGTRGAGATLCLYADGALHAAGVGNVEVRALPSMAPVIASPGILGSRVTDVRVWRTALNPGTRVAVFTDGISERVDLESTRLQPPQAAAQQLLDVWGRHNDDATILVVDAEET